MRFLIWLFLAFLLVSGICYWLDQSIFSLEGNPVYSFKILMIGNILLALVSLFNFLIIKKAVGDKNPNALIRAKTGGMMLKFFVAIGAMLAYIFINNKQVHKPTIFVFLGIYIVYAIIEALELSKIAKGGQNNA